MKTRPVEPARILVVDDEEAVRDVLSRWLTAEGYECLTASNADEASRVLSDDTVPLVLSDIMMPGRSGVDLLVAITKCWPDTAVTMVTALDDRETAIRALQLGAYGYIIKPFDRNEILINVANALERRRLVLESRGYERELETKVAERTAEVRRREREIVLHLAAAMHSRHEETGSHLRRIGMYAGILARALGWPRADVEDIGVAASMHDVGKIGVPDTILLKPGKLSEDEFGVMKTHTTVGAQILDNPDVALLQMAQGIALTHHENWDGSGYPLGLAGDDIPEGGRIVAIADTYDALTHDRVCRPAMPEEEALEIMEGESNERFDPRAFACFMQVLPQVRSVRQQVKEVNRLSLALKHSAQSHLTGMPVGSRSPLSAVD